MGYCASGGRRRVAPVVVWSACLLLVTQACGRSESRRTPEDAAADSAQALALLEARADSLHRWLDGDTTLVEHWLAQGDDPDVAVLGLTRRLRAAESEWRMTVAGDDSLSDRPSIELLADSVIGMQGRRIAQRLRRALAVVPEVATLCDQSPASWNCRVLDVFRGRSLTPRMDHALDTLVTLGWTAERWGTEEERQYWADIGWLAGYYQSFLIRRRLVTREWEHDRRHGVIASTFACQCDRSRRRSRTSSSPTGAVAAGR